MARELTGAQREALEALASPERAACGVSVYDWGIDLRQKYWIHPATLANLEKRGYVALVGKSSLLRRITDAGRQALARSGGDGA